MTSSLRTLAHGTIERPTFSRLASSAMEDEHRETLRRHRVFFVENVDVQYLFIHLVQRDVFTSDDCERIRKQGLTRMDRAELFLDTLVTRGPRAFDALCDALRQRYDFVVRRFLDEEESSSSEDIGMAVGDSTRVRESNL